ncbi:hypothetical protein C7S20_16315 [Christiangramia fulva]|uniref:Uncharacterized protein n=1 Tax=Christiangramia fulva TaxID=2126553 RepID=A0A2R3Z914_9FLAO|nr:PRC-barrel domain-containing protein [Christiangramia fulva]AVR46704.1 hypothetical protein C7S20_16315 [Christiangramia fulva]
MSTREKHLYKLDELKDYKVNHKDPDVRGWSVKDRDNRVIGKVDNLLVNKEKEKVVYIDVEVDESIIDANHDPYSPHHDPSLHEFINEKGENHIIIPIGLVHINSDKKFVYTENINYETFAETKRYRPGTEITRDYERHVLGSYNRGDRTLWPEETEQKHEMTDRDLRRKEEEKMREEQPRSGRKFDSRTASTDMDEKIRREKENLTYKSDRDKPVDNEYNPPRRTHHLNTDVHPEQTLDEDSNWERDRNFESEDPYVTRKRRTREQEREDSFYDRREFTNRDKL